MKFLQKSLTQLLVSLSKYEEEGFSVLGRSATPWNCTSAVVSHRCDIFEAEDIHTALIGSTNSRPCVRGLSTAINVRHLWCSESRISEQARAVRAYAKEKDIKAKRQDEEKGEHQGLT